MKTTILRAFLVIVMVSVLFGLPAPTPVRAGGSAHWTDVPPSLDGAAPAYEWGSSMLISLTNFKLRYENDEQFMYFLIDVTGESPASPPLISNNENFHIYIDTDQDGSDDLLYQLSTLSPNPLYQSQYLVNGWTVGNPCLSYAAAGFGPTLSSATPHRFYEVALRLSEIGALPGHSLTASIGVTSQTPPINEYAIDIPFGMASPLVAFIYNTPAGYTDAQAFGNAMFTTAGIFAEYIPLGQVELIDFSPYRAILVGDDTGDPASKVWYGTGAAVQKIRKSSKPVLGIGAGGINLFDALGLYLTRANSWENDSTGVLPFAFLNPAWSTPALVTLNATVSLYTSPVHHRSVYIGGGDFPWQAVTKIAAEPVPSSHFPILAQRAYGACYTLWGFRSQPGLLTQDGKKLFSNLAWQPACLPAVLYLGGSDTTLRDDIGAILDVSGFPYTLSSASGAATMSFSGYDVILLGWDVPDSTWNNLNNLLAVKNSHLPLVGMGGSGANLLQRMGVPAANPYVAPFSLQKEAVLSNPLQPALMRPYPVAVSSTLRDYFDNVNGGVNIWGFGQLVIPPSETVIGFWIIDHAVQVFAGQPYKGVCYQLYGFKSYPGNMTDQAMDLLRNMLAEPNCNNLGYIPLIKR